MWRRPHTRPWSDPYLSMPAQYGIHAEKNIDMLENVQFRAARFVFHNYHSKFSVTAMLDRLGWPTLQHRRKLAQLSLFYKMLHDNERVDRLELIPPAARQRRGHSQQLSLIQCLHPVQTILIPTTHHQGLDWLAREHHVSQLYRQLYCKSA